MVDLMCDILAWLQLLVAVVTFLIHFLPPDVE